ncbi:homoserine kinase [Clostridium thermopalmarium]|uniref:Homoserine kinase n=1 Tax=Clostridium thermopalmarium DSM 5974 TaxID=1121340 RepID=A0A2T0AU53_9CLOT|nr:homoserine kinase [Clostridium thermopalmarium]PRR74005.1 Homoserine kinase [Clostridium thermopalmarium DSM 5974]PVZ20926.1 homoserine kinase [Clostridium thermopalmarium DSM 5974]
MIRVRIPATTANMGPGFDTLGMALNLYNEIEIEKKRGKTEIYNNGQKSKDDYKENLIYTSLTKTLDMYNYEYNGFYINVSRCDIPISRGLGSSAACIVGGVAAANALMGNIMSTDKTIQVATEIEGHPDNIVPAIVGGMVISLQEGEKISYSKVQFPYKLKFAAMIPNFQVSTAVSRKVLPKSYLKEDCVFNISRSAMLISALYNGEFDKLRTCFSDRIHQPYRKSLIKNAEIILEKAREIGAVGEFISGSGSTLMAVIEPKNAERFEKEAKSFLDSLEDEWKVILLDPDMEGVKVASY